MRYPTLFCWLIAAMAFTGCHQYAIYQSPLQANTNSYKAIPLKCEDVNAATYISGSFLAGGANHRLHDNIFSFNGSLHRSHNFGSFQAYYGVNAVLGSFNAREFLPADSPSVNSVRYRLFNDSAINATAGHKFFGAWGAMGGINVVVPFGRHGGEWRVLGTELSWSSEFGKYLDFRRKLPAGSANIVDRNRNYFTISLFTEILGRTWYGIPRGYKVALITTTRALKSVDPDDAYMNFTSAYLSQTYHLTLKRATLYLQWNVGSYAMNMQTGVNVRLGK